MTEPVDDGPNDDAKYPLADLLRFEADLASLVPNQKGLDTARLMFEAGRRSIVATSIRTSRWPLVCGTALASSIASAAATVLLFLSLGESNVSTETTLAQKSQVTPPSQTPDHSFPPRGSSDSIAMKRDSDTPMVNRDTPYMNTAFDSDPDIALERILYSRRSNLDSLERLRNVSSAVTEAEVLPTLWEQRQRLVEQTNAVSVPESSLFL